MRQTGENNQDCVQVEQTEGLPLLSVNINHAAAARYGVSIRTIQDSVTVAIGGTEVGQVLEGDRRFDLVVRQSHLASQ